MHNQVSIYSLAIHVEDEAKGSKDGMLENTQPRLKRSEEEKGPDKSHLKGLIQILEKSQDVESQKSHMKKVSKRRE